jgi:hypothetical protein
MDGVRRWMGGSPAPSIASQNLHKRAESESSDGITMRKRGKDDRERPNPETADLETIVASLMSPTVSKSEEAEYTWSVLSFQNVWASSHFEKGH